MECCIDERLQDESQIPAFVGEKFVKTAESLARAVIDSRETLTTGMYPIFVKKDFGNMISLLAYACEVPSRRKRTAMDPEEMVEKWLPQIKKLALAHDVDEKDMASSKLDDLLLPIIAAPVAQIREFYRMLMKELKEDKDVPWAVWRLFEFWGENVLDKIEKEHVTELKKELALRIAERSVDQVSREDWLNSMVGALQWRSPEKLEQIEASLDAGHKPRVRGKESCLFMQVGEVEVML